MIGRLCMTMKPGGSSKKIKAKKICFNGLIDHLFTWTLEDVLSDDFYNDKVLFSFSLATFAILIILYFLGSYDSVMVNFVMLLDIAPS